MPAETLQAGDPADQAGRIVIVDWREGAWRVQAAHMEPLRFRSADDADRAGQRVARNLARLGFDARVDIYDDAGERTASRRFAAETGRLRAAARRRRLDD